MVGIELIISTIGVIISVIALWFSLHQNNKNKPRLDVSTTLAGPFEDGSFLFSILMSNRCVKTIENISISVYIKGNSENISHTYGGFDWKNEKIGNINPSKKMSRGRRNLGRSIRLGVGTDEFFYSMHYNERFEYPVNICFVLRGKDMFDQRMTFHFKNKQELETQEFDNHL